MTALATLTIADFCKKVKDPAFFDELKKNFAQVFPESTLSAQEEQAWKNSLPALAALLEGEDIDGHILIEYPMPLGNRRADCILIGADDDGKTHLIIVELKQWSQGTIKPDNNRLLTVYANVPYTTEHPCNQALVYREALNNMLNFGNAEPEMHALAYLHNYDEINNDLLRSSHYNQSTRLAILATKNNKISEAKALLAKLRNSSSLLEWLCKPELRYSDTFITNFSKKLNCSTLFKPTDKQEETFKNILSVLNNTQQCSCVIINGGVGTGKTVLAMMLMRHLMQNNKSPKYYVYSKAIKNCLSDLGLLADGAADSDYMIIDEAHRINKNGLVEFFKNKKLVIFFIDDNQWLHPRENSRSRDIADLARAQKMEIIQHELTTQLRCRGANNYIAWVNNFLYQGALKKLGPDEQFEVKMVDTPKQMEDLLHQHGETKNNTSRIVAGYCWPWKTRNVESLETTQKRDIKINDWTALWNKKDAYAEWNKKPGFHNQVGAIYTVQGFEYDYVGVIIGPDFQLTKNGITIKIEYQHYDKWKTPPEGSDINQEDWEALIHEATRNIYYVLLTRAKKGVFIYAENAALREELKKLLPGVDSPAKHSVH